MNWTTSTTGAATIKGRRAPSDHLEVRCQHTDRLLGWLSGINARAVPGDEPLVFIAGGGDDDMVIEDEDGIATQGLATEVQVANFEAIFPRHNDMKALDEIHQTVPEYAKRRVSADKATCRYNWVAAVVEPHEHEELFDFDNFVPYGVEHRELVETEASFHRLARLANQTRSPLLKPATAAPAVSTLKGSYKPTVSQLGLTYNPAQDLSKTLAGMKVPVSELGKTLNQLGVAAAKAGSEMSRALDQELTKALIGRAR